MRDLVGTFATEHSFEIALHETRHQLFKARALTDMDDAVLSESEALQTISSEHDRLVVEAFGEAQGSQGNV